MSFLLDALGKADEDRRRAEVPELRTFYQRGRSPWRRVLLVLLMLAMLLISFTLGYLFRPYLETRWSGPQTSGAVATSEQDVNQLSAEPVTGPSPGGQGAPQLEAAHELGLDVISYSGVATARFAMINGVVVYEGDVLPSGERVVSIEQNAVLLDREGQTIRVSM